MKCVLFCVVVDTLPHDISLLFFCAGQVFWGRNTLRALTGYTREGVGSGASRRGYIAQQPGGVVEEGCESRQKISENNLAALHFIVGWFW